MEIRPIRPEEHQRLGDLTVDAYLTVDPAIDSGGYPDVLRDVADRAARATVLVAVDGGTLLGGVTYVSGPGEAYAEKLDDGEVGIRMLVVSAEARGRGIGRALTVACIERGVAAGASAVALHSTPAMTVAHSLYLSLGFERTPDRDLYDGGVHLMSFVLALNPSSASSPGTLEPRPGWRNRQAQGA